MGSTSDLILVLASMSFVWSRTPSLPRCRRTPPLRLCAQSTVRVCPCAFCIRCLQFRSSTLPFGLFVTKGLEPPHRDQKVPGSNPPPPHPDPNLDQTGNGKKTNSRNIRRGNAQNEPKPTRRHRPTFDV
ncbi:hypothetical protein NL108_017379 [Boleophthalmus pectinirostris]|nr:hypothetical protein NL108_017379 [Boleophthalmus pectinirostris]